MDYDLCKARLTEVLVGDKTQLSKEQILKVPVLYVFSLILFYLHASMLNVFCRMFALKKISLTLGVLQIVTKGESLKH